MFQRDRVTTRMTDSDTRLAPVWENEAQQHCWLGSLRKNRPHLQDRHNKRLSFPPLDIVMCWCGVWSAINNFGMRESSLKMKPGKEQERGRERNKRGAERTQSHSPWLLPKTSNLCVSSYVSKCCLAFWLLAAKWILTNTVAIIHKKLLETKRQGNQCRPGFWPHFCLAPLSQSI